MRRPNSICRGLAPPPCEPLCVARPNGAPLITPKSAGSCRSRYGSCSCGWLVKLLKVAMNLAPKRSVNLISFETVRSRFHCDKPRSGPPPPPFGPSRPRMKGRNWLYTASGFENMFMSPPVPTPFEPVTPLWREAPPVYFERRTALVGRLPEEQLPWPKDSSLQFPSV